MICPQCSEPCALDHCPACGWLDPVAAVPPAPVAPQTADDYAYGQFRLALFKRGLKTRSMLQTTADGLTAWLEDPKHESWASMTRLPTGCPDRPEPHSLLACLLDEIQSYRASGYHAPPKPDQPCCQKSLDSRNGAV